MPAIQDLLDLLLPTPCVFCRTLGSPICPGCLSALSFDRRSVSRGLLNGFAASSYGASERVLLHALKESGQTSLVGLLAKPMAPLLSELCNQIERPILMPVPSSKQNYLARGFTPAKVLAAHVNRQAHHPCRLIEGLRFVRRVQDQSGLDAIMRRMNLEGAMVASRRLPGAKVILLDDIVTTGSTLAEAARAIEEGGGQVVGFLAFAETILKTQTKI